MKNMNVEQFAAELGLPSQLLLDQFIAAGISKLESTDLITENDRLQLLMYLRKAFGGDAKKSIEELGADGNPVGVEEETSTLSNEPFDPDSISIEPKVVAMDLLLRRLRQGSIRLAPNFQRRFVWDEERCSQLIESLMLRIPLPMFYVAANEDGSWDVVDGLQRLTTIRDFLLGGEVDKNGKKTVPDATPFALTNLEFWGSRFNNKTFAAIEKDQSHARIVNNIMETEMRFTVINPGTPEEVKRNIFKRINTGGMPLTAQEIRHALYQGKASDFLMELAINKNFLAATGNSINDSRMAARELVLRFLAFYIHNDKQYTDDMDVFLSNTMRVINCAPHITDEVIKNIFRNYSNVTIRQFSKEILTRKFELAMERSKIFFKRYAFRKATPGYTRTPINKALFESWANIFAEMSTEDFEALLGKQALFYSEYLKLLSDDEFDRAISRDSSSVISSVNRYKKLRELINITLIG
jgi:hypothetical protein